MTYNSTAIIYNSSKARNLFKWLVKKPLLSSLLYSAFDFRTNPRKPICLNLSRFSSYHTRISHNPNNCIASSSSSKNSIFAENSSATASDPLKREAKMTVTAAPCIKDGSLMVNGKVVLTGVPSNVAVYPVTDGLPSSSAAFLGASSNLPSPRHVFSLGVLRHKIWWMIPRFGSVGSDIPMETQMLLLEVREESAVCDNNFSGQADGNTFYVLFLPVLEGQFRATLQGTPANELEFCIESGDAHVQTTEVSESIFVNSGDNPFELIKESFEMLERRKGTFAHVNHKKKPTHLDWFGWCTWDAFYKDVNPRGIKEGLESFLEGGCPPKFLIIDDGWQDTFNEFQKDGEPSVEGSQFASRLIDLKECSKFIGSDVDISCHDLHDFVKFIKENYHVKYVYVWHALVGYWGGILPSSAKMKKYNPKLTYPVQSPGNVGNYRDIAMDSLEKYGVGLIDPDKVYDFYNDLHSYLSSSGIDGIKVDVQNLIETLGTGYGGRLSLTRRYQEALEESVARNFKENNLICCMSHNTDSIYRFENSTGFYSLVLCSWSSRRSATARASEDFMPREPTLQTLHVASVAFNSLLLGEIVVPDWDMFQSNHYTAEFHGAARALGGCAVYVSDKPGMHDFNILKKLVLPDGSVLRAKYAGRPTRDCLFADTVMDGKSLLKIWNLNKLSGVVGVFNCQGAGNWPLKDGLENKPSSSSKALVLSGHVSPQDIDFLGEVANERWSGDCAVYAFHTGSLSRLSKDGHVQVSLGTPECEVFTISPIRVSKQANVSSEFYAFFIITYKYDMKQALNETLEFAPIGLIDMYNSGGATEGLSFHPDSGCIITVQVQGCGRFGAYSSKRPSYCTVDNKKEEFEYDPANGLLIVKLQGECKSRDIKFSY
ncbi:Galactinol--sucrose galactosyltransferase [Handroanthus impetiginosus]|uniref:galactinol--sucrose galactosyltransferase n=1 Tax=Handroanthus impetiginosus TaxID=429701 RepID=A0A2G9HZY6_9LAMI|nr:Galactinol--sucrose galactosyltransferase [Handroanthus impetiginosus]